MLQIHATWLHEDEGTEEKWSVSPLTAGASTRSVHSRRRPPRSSWRTPGCAAQLFVFPMPASRADNSVWCGSPESSVRTPGPWAQPETPDIYYYISWMSSLIPSLPAVCTRPSTNQVQEEGQNLAYKSRSWFWRAFPCRIVHLFSFLHE